MQYNFEQDTLGYIFEVIVPQRQIMDVKCEKSQ